MRHLWYILNKEGDPVPCDDLDFVDAFLADKMQRRVAFDDFGEVQVSTVFLALDHQWGSGPPLLWETLVFGGEHDGEMDRYTSKADALAGHKKMCELVKNSIPTRKFKHNLENENGNTGKQS